MTLQQASSRIFLTVWIGCSLHFATNTVREIYPALTLGDRLSFDVKDYAGLHPDIFELPGRGWFINNNPGASMVGAVPYVLTRPIIDRVVQEVQADRRARGQTEPPPFDSPWPMAQEFYRQSFQRGYDIKFGIAAGVMQVGAMAPLTALAAVVMFRLLAARMASIPGAAVLALLYAFATPLLFRSGQLNQNLLVAHCGLFAFATLWRPWDQAISVSPRSYLLAGILVGFGVVCDYSGLVVLAAMSVYAVLKWRGTATIARRPLGIVLFFVGGLASLCVLWAYQWSCFGHPLYPAQHYMPAANFTDRGYQGFSLPQADLLVATAFDLRFGLFVSAPLLLLALWFPAWRQRIRLVDTTEFALILMLCGGLFLFCSANQYGRMQFNTGVRHIVPAVPFLFLLAAGCLLTMPRLAAVLVAVGATYVSWCLAMYRDVEQGHWGLPDVVMNITLGGLQLPWLTTLSRMPGLLPLPAGVPVTGASLLILASGCIAAIWLVKPHPEIKPHGH